MVVRGYIRGFLRVSSGRYPATFGDYKIYRISMNSADDMVIKGFQSFDADITKEYFYGYCRRAYLVLDNKYRKNAVCDAMPCPTGVAYEATADIREMYNRPYVDECECSMAENTINMANSRITPEFITSLKENEIFVFGSNLFGINSNHND